MAADTDTPVNPFDADGQFLVLVNERRQHSLWPSFAAIPDGWSTAHGPSPRREALDWVLAHETGPADR
ncbi:MbtH family protein [Streptomyces sp. ZYX-F-203]